MAVKFLHDCTTFLKSLAAYILFIHFTHSFTLGRVTVAYACGSSVTP